MQRNCWQSSGRLCEAESRTCGSTCTCDVAPHHTHHNFLTTAAAIAAIYQVHHPRFCKKSREAGTHPPENEHGVVVRGNSVIIPIGGPLWRNMSGTGCTEPLPNECIFIHKIQLATSNSSSSNNTATT